MGMKFLNKKTWHPSTFRNQERVWKAEQKDEEEKKKLEELQKKLQEERAQQELRQLQVEAGLAPKQERLEFLYDSGLQVGKPTAEEYLLGKPVEEEKKDQGISRASETPGALFVKAEEPVNKNDQWRKLHEDPMLAIRQQEQAALARIRNNPVKMAMIKKQVIGSKESKKEEKRLKKEIRRAERKKRKKEKREKDGDSDSEDRSDREPPPGSKAGPSHGNGRKTHRSRSPDDKKKLNGHHGDRPQQRSRIPDARYRDTRHRERSPLRGRHAPSRNGHHVDKGRHRDGLAQKNGTKEDLGASSMRHGSPSPQRDRGGLSSPSNKGAQRKRTRHDTPIEGSSGGEEPRDEDSREPGYGLSYGRVKPAPVVSKAEVKKDPSPPPAPIQPVKRAPYKAGKLSLEEKAKRLAEMTADAEVHEEQRWVRLKKEAEKDAMEAVIEQSVKAKKTFLDEAEKGIYGAEQAGSIEESVRRRAHFRDRGGETRNAFRR